MNSLKGKTIAGLKWSALERVTNQGITFIISIIIARILTPSDYGVVGMITIFIGIANVFIIGGFGSALIRKKYRTEIDFSTVFYYNVIVSFVFYLLLFVCAPWIARFYNTPILVPVTRIVGLNIIIGAFGAMQRVKLVIAVDFKTQARISLLTLSLTGILGISLAYFGFGVWALIFQHLATTIITTGLLWYFIHWKPLRIFSKSSFKELFGFGSKIMLSGLLDTIYTNIYQVIIGKKYTATDLGYYTRASGFAQLPSVEITSVFQRVTYPVLSEMQDDLPRLAKNYRRLLKMSAFVVFPIMTLLAALAEPLIRILLTEKWLPVVPLLQVLCASHMFAPIHSINLNLLQVKGRSDLFLRLEIIKKIMITAVLFFSFSYGILVICIGMVFVSVFALVINTHYTGKLIHLGFWKQMKDITPVLVISIITGVIALIPSFFTENIFYQLIIGLIAGGTFFLGINFMLKTDEIKDINELILKREWQQNKKRLNELDDLDKTNI
jgi:O-antigen/teichoic acid export membrane protein